MKDYRNAFDEGVKTTTVRKIMDTLPDHVFWDVKTPKNSAEKYYINPYNPARSYQGSSFFDIRSNDQWMHDRHTNTKLNASISRFRQY